MYADIEAFAIRETRKQPGTEARLSPSIHTEAMNPPATPRLADLRTLGREVLGDGWSPFAWPAHARVRLVAVFALLLLCSWAGIALSRQSAGVATIWLSNGLLFGLMITQPPRRWLLYFAVGLSADTLADMVYGDPFRLAIGVSVANSLEVILSAAVLTLIFGFPLDLSRRRPLVGFLIVAVVGATALSSLLGAFWTGLFVPIGAFWAMARTWYLGDMLGMAILAPLVVLLHRPSFFSVLQRKELPHTIAILLVPAIVTVLVFTDSRDPLIFFLFPAFLLVAFRLGFPGTVLTIVLVSLLAIGFTVKGHGPLMLIAGQHMLLHRIVIAQVFIAVVIFTMFPVTALLEEREELKLSLASSEKSFRTLALADELTGLYNRRAFNAQLEAAWHRALAQKQPIALLLLDADLFKQYNDHFGHIEGDECLRTLARVLIKLVGSAPGSGKPPASAARIGGEEFAIILPGSSREDARRLAEAIREAMIARRIPHPGTGSGLQTISLGVAALVPEPGQTATDLVHLADTALYAAKLNGRNQVTCA